MILMFYLEEAVNMLPGSIILHVGVGVFPHHVIDGVHDIRHLLDRQKGGKEARINKTSPTASNSTQHAAFVQTGRARENGSGTSLVMQPSLLRSYRLKAQLSLSVMEPLRMMDRLITKSYSRTKKT